MAKYHSKWPILRTTIFICLLCSLLAPGGNIDAARTHPQEASISQEQGITAFPPTGHFVTHSFPPCTRINVDSTGNIYTYGYEQIHISSDKGYLWQAIDKTDSLAGDIWSFEPSPNFTQDHTIFVGRNYGTNALWISTDKGITWELPAMSITGPILSIAFSPNYAADQVIYLGTRPAPYLYRSIDKGQHWQGISNPGGRGITKVVLSPNYVIDRSIYFLTDNGNLWTMTENQNFAQFIPPSNETSLVSISDFVLSPNFANDKTIFISTDVGVFVSHDSGDNWAYLSPYVFHTLAIAPNYASSHILLGGSISSGMRSDDGGYNWDNVISSGIFNYRFSPNYSSDLTAYANTNDGFMISYDHANTWQIRSSTIKWWEHGLQTIEVSPGFSTDSTVFIGPLMAEFGSLYKSVNGGINLELLPTPETGNIVFTLSGTYPTDQTVFLAFDNRLYFSTNGGYQWTRLPNMPASAFVLRTSPHYSSDKTIFMTSQDGIFRSKNGGSTWQNISATLPSLVVDGLEISPGYPEDPTLFAALGGVFRSDDGGDTWIYPGGGINEDPGVIIRLSSSYPLDRTLFFANSGTTGGGVYRSRDGAETWEDVSYWYYFWGFMRTLSVSPHFGDDQTLIAASENHHVYISEDAGENWFPLKGIPVSGQYGSGLGYNQSGKIIPIVSTPNGVYKYVWPEFTPLAPLTIRTSSIPTDPQYITRQVSMHVSGFGTPGIILEETADWLEITPISGTLPVDFNFRFDTSQLVDQLETIVSADVYWSMREVTHYDIPVVITRANLAVMLPIIHR